MVNRYEIRQRSDETFLFDIWDLVLGDRLFGSYSSRDRAEYFLRKLNAKADTQRLVGFEFAPYTGVARSVKNVMYRTPKAQLRSEGGKVIVEYV